MSPRRLFRDRVDAGRKLASHLGAYRRASPIGLGLPRGGVPVAYEVARGLGAPLDICVVRKVGAPMQPELGLGAVAEDGAVYIDRETVSALGVPEAELARIVEAKRADVESRVRRFRGGVPALPVRDKTVIVVDDGIATGGTARAAIQTLRERGAAHIVLAVPVGASETLDDLASIADEVVCLHPEEAFYAVSLWYDDFTPTTDDDVMALLARARTESATTERRAPRISERVRKTIDREVRIPAGDRWLGGHLTVPPNATKLVLFAHGSGSSRFSPRNKHVATVLQSYGIATLLFDLLSEEEEELDARTAQLRFDIPLLASRLVAATDWAHEDPDTRNLDIGYFGASTGAAAALVAATARPNLVH
ncbi:MAG TPA: phosphoribosyltransferase family protein, partial [Labilithrix sp.]|nr:phosphoribosyltransferase family protein [Labilithrix sp.]